MSRKLVLSISLGVFTSGLTACDEPKVRNCEIVATNPTTNVYQLDYELIIPADCPIPLASPGTETKYAAARLVDLGEIDFDWASVTVENSSGKEVAYEIVTFFLGVAEPRDQYVAATGKKTFDDYDTGIFRAWNHSFSKTAEGKARLTYVQSSLSTSLTGTDIPAPNTSHTWQAPTSGGVPAYQYQWYRNGNPVGTGSSYSATVGETDFDLRVEVTDQTWSTRAAVLVVDVGGVRATMSGPSVVYASEGGGTWTASGEGGTLPYTFDWYLDHQYAGSGSSWSGYPGEGHHDLRVRVMDAVGVADYRAMTVSGIGSEDDTCQPEPPAIQC